MVENVRQAIKRAMNRLAKYLNKASGGKLTPNMVSVLSLAGHGLIAWSLYSGYLAISGVLIIVFGLMDALDGALAREQGTQSAAGMLLDASSDRVKEALIYFGIAGYYVQSSVQPAKILVCLVALAGSMLVSYVKAKGETALTDMSANEKNRALQDGFFRYEVRMALLVVGLFASKYLFTVLVLAAILAWFTAADRFQKIYRRLR